MNEIFILKYIKIKYKKYQIYNIFTIIIPI